MIKQSNGESQLLREVQKEFTRRYPYLKIEAPAIRIPGPHPTADVAAHPVKADADSAAGDWMIEELGLSDTMTVRELENAIWTRFGVSVQVFRRSGKFWIETRMTRDWTLKQQDDHGRELDSRL